MRHISGIRALLLDQYEKEMGEILHLDDSVDEEKFNEYLKKNKDNLTKDYAGYINHATSIREILQLYTRDQRADLIIRIRENTGYDTIPLSDLLKMIEFDGAHQHQLINCKADKFITQVLHQTKHQLNLDHISVPGLDRTITHQLDTWIAELVSNGLDATVPEQSIGKFGSGFLSCLSTLGSQAETITVTTKKEGGQGYQLIFSIKDKEIVLKTEHIQTDFEHGTQITIKRNGEPLDEKSLIKELERKFRANTTAPVIINDKQLNQLQDFIWSKKTKLHSNKSVSVQIHDDIVTVNDMGIGMDAHNLLYHLIFPKSGSKQPVIYDDIKLQKMIRDEVRFGYQTGTQEKTVISCQVAGVSIENIEISKQGIIDNLILIFPSVSYLPESRNQIIGTKEVILSLESILDDLVKSDEALQLKLDLMASIANIIRIVDKRRTSEGQSNKLSLIKYAQKQIYPVIMDQIIKTGKKPIQSHKAIKEIVGDNSDYLFVDPLFLSQIDATILPNSQKLEGVITEEKLTTTLYGKQLPFYSCTFSENSKHDYALLPHCVIVNEKYIHSQRDLSILNTSINLNIDYELDDEKVYFGTIMDDSRRNVSAGRLDDNLPDGDNLRTPHVGVPTVDENPADEDINEKPEKPLNSPEEIQRFYKNVIEQIDLEFDGLWTKYRKIHDEYYYQNSDIEKLLNQYLEDVAISIDEDPINIMHQVFYLMSSLCFYDVDELYVDEATYFITCIESLSGEQGAKLIRGLRDIIVCEGEACRDISYQLLKLLSEQKDEKIKDQIIGLVSRLSDDSNKLIVEKLHEWLKKPEQIEESIEDQNIIKSLEEQALELNFFEERDGKGKYPELGRIRKLLDSYTSRDNEDIEMRVLKKDLVGDLSKLGINISDFNIWDIRDMIKFIGRKGPSEKERIQFYQDMCSAEKLDLGNIKPFSNCPMEVRLNRTDPELHTRTVLNTQYQIIYQFLLKKHWDENAISEDDFRYDNIFELKDNQKQFAERYTYGLDKDNTLFTGIDRKILEKRIGGMKIGLFIENIINQNEIFALEDFFEYNSKYMTNFRNYNKEISKKIHDIETLGNHAKVRNKYDPEYGQTYLKLIKEISLMKDEYESKQKQNKEHQTENIEYADSIDAKIAKIRIDDKSTRKEKYPELEMMLYAVLEYSNAKKMLEKSDSTMLHNERYEGSLRKLKAYDLTADIIDIENLSEYISRDDEWKVNGDDYFKMKGLYNLLYEYLSVEKRKNDPLYVRTWMDGGYDALEMKARFRELINQPYVDYTILEKRVGSSSEKEVSESINIIINYKKQLSEANLLHPLYEGSLSEREYEQYKKIVPNYPLKSLQTTIRLMSELLILEKEHKNDFEKEGEEIEILAISEGSLYGRTKELEESLMIEDLYTRFYENHQFGWEDEMIKTNFLYIIDDFHLTTEHRGRYATKAKEVFMEGSVIMKGIENYNYSLKYIISQGIAFHELRYDTPENYRKIFSTDDDFIYISDSNNPGFTDIKAIRLYLQIEQALLETDKEIRGYQKKSLKGEIVVKKPKETPEVFFGELYQQYPQDLVAFIQFLYTGGEFLTDIKSQTEYPTRMHDNSSSFRLSEFLATSNTRADKMIEISEGSEIYNLILETRDEGFNANRYHQRNRSVIDGQDRGSMIFLRENVQNSIDAIIKKQKISGRNSHDSIDITFGKEGDQRLTRVSDPVGMSVFEVYRYLLPLFSSGKTDGDTGMFGQGFYSNMIGAKEVRVKTSKGDAKTTYLKFTPVFQHEGEGLNNNQMIDFDITTCESDEIFTGTIIERIDSAEGITSNLIAMLGVNQMQKYVGAVDSVAINYNGNPLLAPGSKKIEQSREIPGYGTIELISIKNSTPRLMKDNLYIKEVDNLILDCFPDWVQKIIKDDHLLINLPTKLQLNKTRNSLLHESQTVHQIIQPYLFKVIMEYILNQFCHNGLRIPMLPEDYLYCNYYQYSEKMDHKVRILVEEYYKNDGTFEYRHEHKDILNQKEKMSNFLTGIEFTNQGQKTSLRKMRNDLLEKRYDKKSNLMSGRGGNLIKNAESKITRMNIIENDLSQISLCDALEIEQERVDQFFLFQQQIVDKLFKQGEVKIHHNTPNIDDYIARYRGGEILRNARRLVENKYLFKEFDQDNSPGQRKIIKIIAHEAAHHAEVSMDISKRGTHEVGVDSDISFESLQRNILSTIQRNTSYII